MVCCRCCSSESLGCRLRSLKAAGSLLIIFGIVFAAAGIVIGFIGQLYPELPLVFSEYILFMVLIITAGISAVVTGMAGIFISRTMSDDDWSVRGMSILSLLTIVCSLASVGVPAWLLYEEGYFVGIPSRLNATTTMDPTTMAITTPIAITVATTGAPNTSAMNVTAFMNATVTEMMMANVTTPTAGQPSTPPSTTVTMMVTAPSTNATMMVTAPSTNATMMLTADANATDNANSTAVTSMNTTMSTGDGANTTADPTTPSTMEASNSTADVTTAVTLMPIEFRTWISVIVPFAVVCFFAFIFICFALMILCIGCCCPERSEIVDDKYYS